LLGKKKQESVEQKCTRVQGQRQEGWWGPRPSKEKKISARFLTIFIFLA